MFSYFPRMSATTAEIEAMEERRKLEAAMWMESSGLPEINILDIQHPIGSRVYLDSERMAPAIITGHAPFGCLWATFDDGYRISINWSHRTVTHIQVDDQWRKTGRKKETEACI